MNFFSALTTHRVICTCALALGALVPAARAVAQHATVLAEIPFAFQDGHRSFPAGKYRIEMVNEHTLLLRNSSNTQIGLAMTVGELTAQAPRSAKVVFHKYGDQYFLSDVWLADKTLGCQMVMSRAEKELRGTPAKRPAPGTQIALNATQP